jgi:hypothetical protein
LFTRTPESYEKYQSQTIPTLNSLEEKSAQNSFSRIDSSTNNRSYEENTTNHSVTAVELERAYLIVLNSSKTFSVAGWSLQLGALNLRKLAKVVPDIEH